MDWYFREHVLDRDREVRRVHLTARDQRLGAAYRDGRLAIEAAVRRATNLDWDVTRWAVSRGDVSLDLPPRIVAVGEALDAGSVVGYRWFFLRVPSADVSAARGHPRPLIELPDPWESGDLDVPYIGEIRIFGSKSLPVGWLRCNGVARSRSEYSALFDEIGTEWGEGDGVSTFNVPDSRGRVPVGWGTGDGLSPRVFAAVGGSEEHVLSEDQLPSHSHGTTALPSTGSAGSAPVLLTGVEQLPVFGRQQFSLVTDSTGAGEDVAHMPPFFVGNYGIYAGA